MGLSSRVLAQSSSRFDDYKALVCVFLFGGNDSFNLLVPTNNSEYNTYQSIRQTLAYEQDSLLSITPQNSQPYAVGIPEAASSIHSLFASQKLSFVANMGPLAQPVTKSMIVSDSAMLPPQLFSHNDQQSLWQSGNLNTGSASGWGGRIADLIGDTSDSLSMNLSIFGNNLMQSGTIVQPFAVDAEGPESFLALDPDQNANATRIAAFEQMLANMGHPLSGSYTTQINSANANNQRLLDALATVSPTSVNYPNSSLGGQLKMVANLIASQPSIGQQRQIFFVGMGGWDTHDAQAEVHPALIATLGDALAAFQQDLDERLLQDKVTTFTMSDFGRTLTSNGDGTDHGWGGHQMIMGGAVNGGNIFGTMPEIELGSDDDLEDGRMIPTLSIDQFGSDISRWFGLSDNELNAIFPNRNRFDESALSMFKAE
jgi:uncharacterized protein (DUF1501 family)